MTSSGAEITGTSHESGELLVGSKCGPTRRSGEACIGVIGAHALGETIYAAAGHGCWYRRDGSDPQRVWTSAVTDPKDAFVVSTGLEHTDLDPRDPQPSIGLSRLYRQARRFRWSGDCVNNAMLCQGRIDAAIDPRMNPWDIAAVVPCVREAGEWCQPGLVASANPTLHGKILRSLREAA